MNFPWFVIKIPVIYTFLGMISLHVKFPLGLEGNQLGSIDHQLVVELIGVMQITYWNLTTPFHGR